MVVKLPTADEDAVRAFEREAHINVRIASFAGMPGIVCVCVCVCVCVLRLLRVPL